MSAVDLSTGFPPIGATIVWRMPSEIPGVTVKFRASAETWRPAGPQRIYRLRTEAGQLVTAIIDFDPDTGRLQMIGCADGVEPFTAQLVVHP